MRIVFVDGSGGCLGLSSRCHLWRLGWVGPEYLVLGLRDPGGLELSVQLWGRRDY